MICQEDGHLQELKPHKGLTCSDATDMHIQSEVLIHVRRVAATTMVGDYQVTGGFLSPPAAVVVLPLSLAPWRLVWGTWVGNLCRETLASVWAVDVGYLSQEMWLNPEDE